MSTNEIKVTYADLETAKLKLENLVEQAADLHRALEGRKSDLNGRWVGYGADSFFKEMHEDILPAVKRLEAALNEAATLTNRVSVEFLETETSEAGVIKALDIHPGPEAGQKGQGSGTDGNHADAGGAESGGLNPSAPWGDVP
ncbi:MAG: WXG100 family type VII secretion target, partial [Chloroflexota bacterium]